MVQIPCSFLTMEYLVFTQELDLGETGQDLDAQRVVASKMAAFVDLPGASTSTAVESGPLVPADRDLSMVQDIPENVDFAASPAASEPHILQVDDSAAAMPVDSLGFEDIPDADVGHPSPHVGADPPSFQLPQFPERDIDVDMHQRPSILLRQDMETELKGRHDDRSLRGGGAMDESDCALSMKDLQKPFSPRRKKTKSALKNSSPLPESATAEESHLPPPTTSEKQKVCINRKACHS